MEKEVNKMKLFKNLSDDPEAIKNFTKKQFDDDEKLKKYFDQCTHKEFVSAIMHLGTLFDITTTYLDFILPQINEAIQTLEGNALDRKMNKYIKDLNLRINSEYNFDKDVVVIEKGVLFDEQLYLFINKSYFIKLFEINEL